MKGLYYLDLFSGIGGFAYGLYLAGLRFQDHFFSEIDNYSISIYRQRFPDAIPLGDAKDINYKNFPVGKYIVTAGFPCQPHSLAGNKLGENDERDMWDECSRMLRELRPLFTLFENVPGVLTSNGGKYFNRVVSEISEIGYDAEWEIIPASDAGAPHKRSRIWIMVYPAEIGCIRSNFQNEAYKKSGYEQGHEQEGDLPSAFFGGICSYNRLFPAGLDVRMDYGVPERLEPIGCLGNAVVPQVVMKIFLSVKQIIERFV